jgi:CII-binding regulator of phage lambda lysogenization HflD
MGRKLNFETSFNDPGGVAMNDDELRQLLEELHEQIENTDSVDEKGRELLDHLSMDIRRLLDRTGHEAPRATSREVSRLEESIRHFEVTHPTLTATLSQLLNILNNAGI